MEHWDQRDAGSTRFLHFSLDEKMRETTGRFCGPGSFHCLLILVVIDEENNKMRPGTTDPALAEIGKKNGLLVWRINVSSEVKGRILLSSSEVWTGTSSRERARNLLHRRCLYCSLREWNTRMSIFILSGCSKSTKDAGMSTSGLERTRRPMRSE